MSDLFFEAFTNEEIAAVFGVMAACPHLTFQVLTKRAERMREWFRWVESVEIPLLTIPRSAKLVCAGAAQDTLSKRWTVAEPRSWPLPNVWLGLSVESQEYADRRIPLLLDTPAAVRFVSAEPLLGPVDIFGTSEEPGGGWHKRASAPDRLRHRDRVGRRPAARDRLGHRRRRERTWLTSVPRRVGAVARAPVPRGRRCRVREAARRARALERDGESG